MTENKRFFALDGIRGWASVMVLLSHVIYDICGQFMPELRSDFLKIFMSGGLAVSVFFILSGDALSTHFIHSGKREALEKLVIKRYFRLFLPIFCSVILVFVIVKLDLSYHKTMIDKYFQSEWLRNFDLQDHKLMVWLKFVVMGVFTEPNSVDKFNPMLWTMPIEMAGSMMVFIYLFLHHRFEKPMAVLIPLSLILLFADSRISAFFIGVIFSLLRKEGFFEEMKKKISHAIMALMVFYAVYSFYYLQSYSSSFIKFHIIFATLFVFIFYSNVKIINFFENNISLFLGKISFPLYLTHLCIILTVTFGSIEWLIKINSLNYYTITIVIFISLAMSFLLAYLFSPIEELSIKFSNKMADFLIAPSNVFSKFNIYLHNIKTRLDYSAK